ncbi:MAG: transketolase [Acidimicrobiales bacterium]|jgi:transketolase
MTAQSIEQQAVATIAGLSMDAPHAARSGHQGTAMALAPLAHVLYTRIMDFDAATPDWADRDRFVLSPGHASILQYSLLHLCGFGLTLDDIKDFRQWRSATPGHPEVGHTAGVEITTGPLGQGFATSVGMAMAEARQRAHLGTGVVDHYTYTICSDGDLAEGVSHEAASFAGHLGLGRLICIYDDNRVSIDGMTDIWLSDDPVARFTAYGWHVVNLGEIGNDLDALEAAILAAKEVTDKPSMLVLQTHIGTPSPTLTDSPSAHGYAFKDDEIAAAKEVLGLDPTLTFQVSDDVLEWYNEAGSRGAAKAAAWAAANPTPPSLVTGQPDGDWKAALPVWEPGDNVATRKSSNAVLNAIAPMWPSLVAGGADLTGNTGVKLNNGVQVTADNLGGNQVYYGVREHAMAAVMNGMALHGGALPVGGTFLVFSDYCRPSIRLAALSKLRVVYSFTHDSVGVGEDGPTHQPIEHVAALRSIPDLSVIRPADANESAGAWAVALETNGPTALVLSRQDLPVLDTTSAASVAMGGYVLSDPADAVITLMGAGSEVQLCVEAARRLGDQGKPARVVSMPSMNLFQAQDVKYRNATLKRTLPSVAIEAGVSQGWYRYADEVVGINRFGASAPGATVMHELGMNVNNLVDHALEVLQ